MEPSEKIERMLDKLTQQMQMNNNLLFKILESLNEQKKIISKFMGGEL